MQRGVVVSSELITRNKNDSGFTIQRTINPVEMNYLALYWDKIVIPSNNIIHTGVSNEDVFMESGVLERPRYSVNGAFNTDDYSDLQVKLQSKTVDVLREKIPDSDWRIHQFGGDFLSRDSFFSESARIELANLLPVPSVDVHIHEILEFKERRASELAALHSYSDDLYLEILNSGDPDLTKAKTMSKLKKIISDIDKLNNESWRSPIKFNLQISNEVDIAKIKSLYLTVAGAATTGHPLESLIVGGLCTFLEGYVSLKVGLQSVRPGGGNELIYLSNARKEKII
ncbi:DUF6236 family protein [Morganella morganii]|uniref:DUF6236 family protein n=1 Tax=Morganella morganii TaxID=582 RepID=A0A9Q4GSY1_MORMO|nr:DUF6236 family protein [Morganella morganii]MCY0791969.1 DUF6236 family protein [Morganella morganii]